MDELTESIDSNLFTWLLDWGINLFNTCWLEALEIGDRYGVNPIIFATIYIGAIPCFTIVIGWLVKRYKDRASILLPTIVASGFFLSAYIYAILFGENLPWWFYAIVIGWVVVGAYFTIKSTKLKLDNTTESI